MTVPIPMTHNDRFPIVRLNRLIDKRTAADGMRKTYKTLMSLKNIKNRSRKPMAAIVTARPMSLLMTFSLLNE